MISIKPVFPRGGEANNLDAPHLLPLIETIVLEPIGEVGELLKFCGESCGVSADRSDELGSFSV
jgi:hypothetical protein